MEHSIDSDYSEDEHEQADQTALAMLVAAKLKSKEKSGDLIDYSSPKSEEKESSPKNSEDDGFETVKPKKREQKDRVHDMIVEAERVGFKHNPNSKTSRAHDAECFLDAYNMPVEKAQNNVHAVINAMFQPTRNKQTGESEPSKAFQAARESLKRGQAYTCILRIPAHAVVNGTYIVYNTNSEIGTPIGQVLAGFACPEIAAEVKPVRVIVEEQYRDLYLRTFGPNADTTQVKCQVVYSDKQTGGPFYYVNLTFGSGLTRRSSPSATPNPKPTVTRSAVAAAAAVAKPAVAPAKKQNLRMKELMNDAQYQALIARECLLSVDVEDSAEAAQAHEDALAAMKKYRTDFLARN